MTSSIKTETVQDGEFVIIGLALLGFELRICVKKGSFYITGRFPKII